MKRLLEKSLLEWKNKNDRMPLLLDGARQVGKSYLIEHLFGNKHFQRVIKLDFLQEPGFAQIFSDSKNPETIISGIQLELAIDIDPENDLIFFDEIGECQNAVDSLKFFQEQRPELYICASGSNIGLLNRFPVGKVEEYRLYPMTFEEFVISAGNEQLTEMYQASTRNEFLHEKLWKYLLDYYFVGGMPKAVHTWFEGDRSKLNALIASVRAVHSNLISGYIRDFGKYGRYPSEAIQTQAVFENIPKQLMKNMDGSVKRYQFSHVIPRKKGYQELRSPIDFLIKTRLASQNFVIEGEPQSTLFLQAKESRFKLFFFDLGLLHCMANMSYKEIVQQNFAYKGYVAENFVQNEAVALGHSSTYSWHSGRQAELEFLFKNDKGEVIPVEVKSGTSIKAKSMGIYIKNYSPVAAYKLTGKIGGFRNSVLKTIPLYYAHQCIKEMTGETGSE